MELSMPRAAITSANSGEGGKAGPYKAPHERMNGPFEDYELEDGARTMERAEQIKGNPKYMAAIAEHHKKKAKHHHKLAESMKPHMKRGLVSEKAAAKASEKYA